MFVGFDNRSHCLLASPSVVTVSGRLCRRPESMWPLSELQAVWVRYSQPSCLRCVQVCFGRVKQRCWPILLPKS